MEIDLRSLRTSFMWQHRVTFFVNTLTKIELLLEKDTPFPAKKQTKQTQLMLCALVELFFFFFGLWLLCGAAIQFQEYHLTTDHFHFDSHLLPTVNLPLPPYPSSLQPGKNIFDHRHSEIPIPPPHPALFFPSGIQETSRKLSFCVCVKSFTTPLSNPALAH